MKRINLTEIAELHKTPISHIDTYGQISGEKIQEMDDRGYDIIQSVRVGEKGSLNKASFFIICYNIAKSGKRRKL